MKKGFLSGNSGGRGKKAYPATSSPAPQATASPCSNQEHSAAAHAHRPSDRISTGNVSRTSAPFISERLRHLIEASSLGILALCDAGREGRGVELSKPALSGDVLLRAECYATVVADEYQADICTRCMSPETKARCIGCGTGFCNDACLQDAGAEHAAECYALSKLQSIPLSHDTDFESARLALRCLARRAVEAPASDDLHFRDVEDLLTHRLATLRSSMLASVSTDAQLLIPLLPFPCADVGVKGLTELLLRIKFNAHPVRDSWERRTGVGLYPAASILNHSCSPNAIISFAPGGGELLMRATKNIPVRGRVFYSYVEAMQPRSSRRKALQDAFFFDCQCARCRAEMRATEGDGAMDAVLCSGGCNGLLLGSVEDIATVSCAVCGKEHVSKDLKNLATAFEESMRSACGHQDATLRRAALGACLASPEGIRLAPTHHLVHQAKLALALVCRDLGDAPTRLACLGEATAAYLAWDPPSSAHLASLLVSLGVALAQAGNLNASGITEVERGLAMQRLCLGEDSLVVETTTKVLEKLRQCRGRDVVDF